MYGNRAKHFSSVGMQDLTIAGGSRNLSLYSIFFYEVMSLGVSKNMYRSKFSRHSIKASHPYLSPSNYPWVVADPMASHDRLLLPLSQHCWKDQQKLGSHMEQVLSYRVGGHTIFFFPLLQAKTSSVGWTRGSYNHDSSCLARTNQRGGCWGRAGHLQGFGCVAKGRTRDGGWFGGSQQEGGRAEVAMATGKRRRPRFD